MADAPNDTREAAAFLQHQHEINSHKWGHMCLSLQRTARNIPRIVPSAIAAMHITPHAERVPHINSLRRGMVAYSDNPHDSNPYGHIYFILGRRKGYLSSSADGWWTWSNDVKHFGDVDVVPLSFYQNNWGVSFKFAATWLNGYNFADLDKKPVPDHPTLSANFTEAMHLLSKEIRRAEREGHPGLVRALKRDLANMRETQHKYKD